MAVGLRPGHFQFSIVSLMSRSVLSFTFGIYILAMRKIVMPSAQQKIFVVRPVVGDRNLRVRI